MIKILIIGGILLLIIISAILIMQKETSHWSESFTISFGDEIALNNGCFVKAIDMIADANASVLKTQGAPLPVDRGPDYPMISFLVTNPTGHTSSFTPIKKRSTNSERAYEDLVISLPECAFAIRIDRINFAEKNVVIRFDAAQISPQGDADQYTVRVGEELNLGSFDIIGSYGKTAELKLTVLDIFMKPGGVIQNGKERPTGEAIYPAVLFNVSMAGGDTKEASLTLGYPIGVRPETTLHFNGIDIDVRVTALAINESEQEAVFTIHTWRPEE